MDYIDLPIETDPENVLDDAYTYMKTAIPGWQPSIGQLDVWMLQAISNAAAAARDVASAVPTSIFRWFGAYLIGLPPVDSVPAFGYTTWTMIDNLGHTIPAGTQVAIPDAGGNMIIFQTVIDVIVLPGASVTAVGGVQIIAVDAGVAGNALGGVTVAIQLIDPLNFVLGVTTSAATGGGQDAEDDPTYLNRLAAEMQLLAPRPILPGDFSVFARIIDDAWRTLTIDGYNPAHNFMSLNAASVETSIADWANLANAALAQSGTFFKDGVSSLRLTAASAADMSVMEAASHVVVPGETYTATAFFRTAVTARACKVGIQWRDVADANVGAVVYGATVNDSAANFNAQPFVTAVAPPTGVKARVVLFVTAPVNAEIHYADEMSLRHGSTTDWVPGGTIETGNERMVCIFSVKQNGVAVGAGTKADQIADLDARREVNFVINASDPTSTQIDVTWQIKALAGYDHAALLAAVNAAITNYLMPSTWGVPINDLRGWNNLTTVRYLEIAQVINDVPGVDFITTTGGNYDLTIGVHGGGLARADVALAGVAPLPVAATLTGVVT